MLLYLIVVLLVFGRPTDGRSAYCDHFCHCDSRLSHWICRVPKVSQSVSIDLDQLPVNSLRKLELTNLQLKQSGRLIKFRNLIEMRLRNVSLNELPRNWLQSQLVTLDLSNNNLKKLTNTMLQMPALEQLDLSKNQLTSIDTLFDHLSSLKQLNLSFNLISRLSEHSFRNLTQLQYLNLKSNRLHVVELGSFYHLTNLVKLVLDDNMRLDHLKLDLFSLRMRSLHLAATNLTVVPQSIDEHIRELYLEHNLLEHLTIGDFEHLTSLCVLHLEHNLLSEIEYDTFGRLAYLVELYLSSNHLLQVPQFPKLLKVLSLSDNLITELNCSSLAHLVHLTTLDLSANHIQTLEADCLASFDQLQYLDLSENQLTSVDNLQFAALKQLQSLNLSGNELIKLSPNSFLGLENLKQLELSSIRRPLASCFNEVTRQFIFDHLRQLQILNLSDSPFLADCIFDYDSNSYSNWNASASSPARRKQPISVSDKLLNLEKLIAKDLNAVHKLNLTRLQRNLPQLSALDIQNSTLNCDNANLNRLTVLIGEHLKGSLQLVGLDEWTCSEPKRMRRKRIIDLILPNQTADHHRRLFADTDRLYRDLRFDYPKANQLVNLKQQIKWSKLMSAEEAQLALKLDQDRPLLFERTGHYYLINLFCLTTLGVLLVVLSHLIIRRLQMRRKLNDRLTAWFRSCRTNPTGGHHRFRHVNYSKQQDDVFIIAQSSSADLERREVEGEPLIS